MALQFTRPTILAAIEFLEKLHQAQFNQLVLRLNLENEIPSNTDISVGKKCALMGKIVANDSGRIIETLNGNMSLGEMVVREAIQQMNQYNQDPKQTALVRGLARDGYSVSWDSDYGTPPNLRNSLPEDIDLPKTDDEVHQLLKTFNFKNSLGHLQQAIKAHTEGSWAAANGQIRTFLESLFDEITHYSFPREASSLSTSENLRSLLADKGFFSQSRNEWTSDGKNFINGLFKMLHTDGSHPGLSDEEHSTFRLHIALVTARTFLNRLKKTQTP